MCVYVIHILAIDDSLPKKDTERERERERGKMSSFTNSSSLRDEGDVYEAHKPDLVRQLYKSLRTRNDVDAILTFSREMFDIELLSGVVSVLLYYKTKNGCVVRLLDRYIDVRLYVYDYTHTGARERECTRSTRF
jgi:hypothetical protein